MSHGVYEVVIRYVRRTSIGPRVLLKNKTQTTYLQHNSVPKTKVKTTIDLIRGALLTRVRKIDGGGCLGSCLIHKSFINYLRTIYLPTYSRTRVLREDVDCRILTSNIPRGEGTGEYRVNYKSVN